MDGFGQEQRCCETAFTRRSLSVSPHPVRTKLGWLDIHTALVHWQLLPLVLKQGPAEAKGGDAGDEIFMYKRLRGRNPGDPLK